MNYRKYPEAKKRRWPSYVIGVFAIVLIAFGALFFLKPTVTEAPSANKTEPTTQTKLDEKDTPPKPTLVNLQPTVDTWVAGQPGNYGIVVYDPANDAVVASHQAEDLYYTASMYKLSVAYLSLIDFQTGKQDPNEIIVAGQTRKECVYKMVHNSDNTCGEAMMNDIGQATLGQRNVNELGLTNPIFSSFQTTSADMVTILKRLQANKDLNAENTAFLLDAMKTQIYRTGVPAGMPEATIADKIGFDSPDLWVDGGIMYLPNGRQYIYCIFGDGGVGSAQIRNFAETIYPVLNPAE